MLNITNSVIASTMLLSNAQSRNQLAMSLVRLPASISVTELNNVSEMLTQCIEWCFLLIVCCCKYLTRKERNFCLVIHLKVNDYIHLIYRNKYSYPSMCLFLGESFLQLQATVIQRGVVRSTKYFGEGLGLNSGRYTNMLQL